jgi:hypothetical protein
MFLVGNLSQPKSIGNSSWMDLQALKCSLNVKLPQNIIFEWTTRNNAQWNTNMGISVVMIDGSQYPPLHLYFCTLQHLLSSSVVDLQSYSHE